jgi:hypothetical protein
MSDKGHTKAEGFAAEKRSFRAVILSGLRCMQGLDLGLESLTPPWNNGERARDEDKVSLTTN